MRSGKHVTVKVGLLRYYDAERPVKRPMATNNRNSNNSNNRNSHGRGHSEHMANDRRHDSSATLQQRRNSFHQRGPERRLPDAPYADMRSESLQSSSSEPMRPINSANNSRGRHLKKTVRFDADDELDELNARNNSLDNESSFVNDLGWMTLASNRQNDDDWTWHRQGSRDSDRAARDSGVDTLTSGEEVSHAHARVSRHPSSHYDQHKVGSCHVQQQSECQRSTQLTVA